MGVDCVHSKPATAMQMYSRRRICHWLLNVSHTTVNDASMQMWQKYILALLKQKYILSDLDRKEDSDAV